MRLLFSLFLAALAAFAAADADAALRLARARLDLAEDVALAKLYSRGPIEDLARERQVIERVRGEAARIGVDPDLAARFFAAQIEASKAAQRAWQAKWAREGAPFRPRPDLARSVRPKLDALTPRILRALADARPGARVDRYGPREPWLKAAWAIASEPLAFLHSPFGLASGAVQVAAEESPYDSSVSGRGWEVFHAQDQTAGGTRPGGDGGAGHLYPAGARFGPRGYAADRRPTGNGPFRRLRLS